MDIPTILNPHHSAGELQRSMTSDMLSQAPGSETGESQVAKYPCWPNRIKKRKRRPSTKQKQCDADNSKILNLTLDVNNLRQQVQDYMMRKSVMETRLLVAREQFHGQALRSLGYFFEMVKYGYPTDMSPQQRHFLDVLLDDNVSVGGGVKGRDPFREQWRRYKELFQVRRLRTFTMQIISSDVDGCLIECCGEFQGTLTAAALKAVFPHVLQSEDLTQRLLHRHFVCPTRSLICLDAKARVVLFDACADLFTAMSSLLDCNPVLLARLMTNATISDGSMLPSPDDGHEDTCQEDTRGNYSAASNTPARNSIDFILS